MPRAAVTVYEDSIQLVTVYEDPHSWIRVYKNPNRDSKTLIRDSITRYSTARQLFQIHQLSGVQECLLLDQELGEEEQGRGEELSM